MFKVTLKIKPNGEWVDGPVSLIETGEELTEFSKTHEYFKVEPATVEDMKLYGMRIPAAFEGFLK